MYAQSARSTWSYAPSEPVPLCCFCPQWSTLLRLNPEIVKVKVKAERAADTQAAGMGAMADAVAGVVTQAPNVTPATEVSCYSAGLTVNTCLDHSMVCIT
jgi:hypothetical protein